jgi:hypothetical protein
METFKAIVAILLPSAETFKTLVTLIIGISWPVAAVWIARIYQLDIRLLLPRVRKAGPTGIEFDAVQQQQHNKSDVLPGELKAPAETAEATEIAAVSKQLETDKSSGQLKMLPGVNRSKAVAVLEEKLHESLKNYSVDIHVDILLHYLAEARLETIFEKIYRGIFGSQIAALRLVSKSPRATFADLFKLFFPYKEKDQEFYEKYGFEGWMGFLETEGLLITKNENIEITDLGLEFLQYLDRRRLPENKPY